MSAPPNPAMLEAGRRLFAQACTFIAGADTTERLPPPGATEVAFAGRSNVGKSSLLNALTGRKALARVSNTPGRTQQINFFALGDRLVLADLPGYGFAKAPRDVVERWLDLIEAYLLGRPTLRRVILLIDARHGVKPPDRAWMKRFDESAVVFQVVLTKADKISPAELDKRVAEVTTELGTHTAAHPHLIATSAVTDAGIAELRAAVAELASPG